MININKEMDNVFQVLNAQGEDIKDEFPSLVVNFLGKGASVIIHEPLAIKSLRITCGNNVKVTIKKKLHARGSLVIDAKASNTSIEIGEGFTCALAYISYLDEQGLSLKIGDNCLFAHDVFIRSSDGHCIYDNDTGEILNRPDPLIEIGNHVWCGREVKILKGARIADDCVVGLGSIVSGKYTEKNCVLAGIPARVVKRNINWARQHYDTLLSDNLVDEISNRVNIEKLRTAEVVPTPQASGSSPAPRQQKAKKTKSLLYKILHFYWLRK